MDDDVMQRVLKGGGRDCSFLPHPSSILQSLSLHVQFKYLEAKEGLVMVGIGGPSGSGKTSLADKVASVLGCIVISMENYRNGVDEVNDLDSIDFNTLVQNLETYLQIILESLPAFERSSTGIHGRQAAKLQELGSSSAGSESSLSRRGGIPVVGVLEDLQLRVKRLERWHIINTVLWTFLMYALVGYSLYQKKRQ